MKVFKPSIAHGEASSLGRHVVWAIALLILVSVALFGVLALQLTRAHSKTASASEYHGSSVLHIARIEWELSEAESLIFDGQSSPSEASRGAHLHALSLSADVIQKEFDVLYGIQRQFADPVFDAPLRRAHLQCRKFEALVTSLLGGEDIPSEAFRERVRYVRQSLEQLERLHVVVHDQYKLAAAENVGWFRFLTLAGFMVAIGAATILVLLRLVSRAIRVRQRSEERFALAVRGSSDGIWDWNLDTEECFFSERFAELLGYGPNEFRCEPSTMVNHVHPDDADVMQQAIVAHLKERAPYDRECRMRTKSGFYRWFRSRGQALWDAKGRARRMSGSLQDVTDLKDTASTLRESEAWLRTLIEHAPTGVLVFDVEANRFIEANSVVAGLLKRDREELLQLGPTDISPPRQPNGEPSDAMARDLVSRAVNGEVVVVEWMHSDPSGHSIPCEVRLVRLPSKHRVIVRGNVADIRERKEAECKLQEYQEQLQSLASEMFLAEERERRRIATALHDHALQTLAAGKLRLAELRHRMTDDDQRPLLTSAIGLIEDTVRELRSLTFELSPPVLYELGFYAAVEWLADRMREKHGVDYVLTGDRGTETFGPTLDVTLFQIVRELLVNVVKHANASRVEIEIYRTRDDAYVRIRDDGVGFDPTTMDPTRSQTGFGLFSIRERVNRLLGSFDIESTPEHGTSITLAVPLQTSDELDAQHAPV